MKIIFRYFIALKKKINNAISCLLTRFVFKCNGVLYINLLSKGVPYVSVKDGVFKIGANFKINNGYAANIIGRQQKCIFNVNSGRLTIGDNTGMSSTAIFCQNEVTIGSNVKIGGNVVIYDTDFHSLDAEERIAVPEIKTNVKTNPVVIKDNVFIGAHSTILKGSTIGENSIIGACSVVSGEIPANEIWAGNPVKFIRKVK